MSPRATRNYVLFAMLGGFAFWTPDALAHAIPLRVPTSIVAFTVIGPMCAFVTYLLMRRQFPASPRAVPLWMLLGIWIFGPLGIAVGMIPLGGTFLQLANLRAFMMLCFFFPIATFSMSTYSGSLGGVVLVTLLFLVLAVMGRQRSAASNFRWSGP